MSRLFATLVLLFLPLLMHASEPSSQPLNIGDSGPRMNVPTHQGDTLTLDSQFYEGLVLFFFYPKADTPGCTRQACSLRDAYPQLLDAGVKILGVSFDSQTDQRLFAEKYELPYPLIPDPEGKIIQAFGVPQRTSADQAFASRQAFLLENGRIIWRDLSASTDAQAEDVLKFLNNR